MTEDKRIHWKSAIRISGAFVATIIGSGFASGQELVQFFTVYNIAGAVGAAIVSFLIYALFTSELFRFGKEQPPEKQSAFFTAYFGKRVGAALDWFCAIYIYGVFFIMLSGAGATMNQYFGVPNMVGSIIMAVVCAVTVLLGLKKLVDVMGTIGPVLVVATIVIGLYALIKNAGNLALVDETLPQMDFMKAAPNWFISGIIYPCFSYLTLTPVLPSMSAQAPNKRTSITAGIIGCLAFHLALLALVFAMFANLDVLGGKLVPNIALATVMDERVALVFSVMILLAIYSSACPMMWGTASKLFKDEHSLKYKLGTLALIGGGMVVSYFFPLDVLINFIFGLTGYAGAAIMAAMFVSKFILYRKKKMLKGENNEVH